MRSIALFLAVCGAVYGQSMTEAGGMLAGSVVGSAAGKKLNESTGKSLKRTAGILESAAKTGAASSKATSGRTIPSLQVGAGVPKAELNNVPPPPPPARKVAAKPVRSRTLTSPVLMSVVVPISLPAEPVNVNLAEINTGMQRERVLALGQPSARITSSDDGHLAETYQYHNKTYPSGTVRLRDGAVYSVETRP